MIDETAVIPTPAAAGEPNQQADAPPEAAPKKKRGKAAAKAASAAIEGRIAPAPSGAGGFGYDPIFFYPPYGRTLAEASREQKAAVSHRGQAFRALRRFLETVRL